MLCLWKATTSDVSLKKEKIELRFLIGSIVEARAINPTISSIHETSRKYVGQVIPTLATISKYKYPIFLKKTRSAFPFFRAN